MLQVDFIKLALTVEAVRQAVRAKTVRCSGACIAFQGASEEDLLCRHKEHGYAGRIPDPAYAPLLAVVEEGYPACGGIRPRDWSNALPGALEGALLRAIVPIAFQEDSWDTGASRLCDTLVDLARTRGECRQLALEAIVKWLKDSSTMSDNDLNDLEDKGIRRREYFLIWLGLFLIVTLLGALAVFLMIIWGLAA